MDIWKLICKQYIYIHIFGTVRNYCSLAWNFHAMFLGLPFCIWFNPFHPSVLNRLFSLAYISRETGLSAAMTPRSSDVVSKFSYSILRLYLVVVGRSEGLLMGCDTLVAHKYSFISIFLNISSYQSSLMKHMDLSCSGWDYSPAWWSCFTSVICTRTLFLIMRNVLPMSTVGSIRGIDKSHQFYNDANECWGMDEQSHHHNFLCICDQCEDSKHWGQL